MWIPTPVFALARNDSASRRRDVGDAVPYGIARGCVQEGGELPAPAGGGCGFPRQCAHWLGMTALRAVGTSRTPSPTKSQGGACGQETRCRAGPMCPAA
uniref:Uncharacterized protein n=1 Tax=Podoviridae sp. ctsaV5 TaxID=2826583 RepID=A0A8S5MPF3_9CAUD|nr:MAG TPA: hypothetical protein [Podoviridae sp. ctsaV5]